MNGPAGEFEPIALGPIERLQRYKILMGSVVPRPIALVSTLNAAGGVNAAPFSNFMVVSTSPALLAFAVGSEGRASNTEKDTLRNVRMSGEFVVNTVPDTLAETVQACGQAFLPEVSEVDALGLTTVPSSMIRTPRVAETLVQFECRLHSIVRLGESHLVVGEAVMAHARIGLVRDYKVDIRAYGPLGRVGGRVYCRIGELIKV
ncbi:MAG: flavin reductase family protein [Pigmentiphaga sp.]|uniref:flavin reductase family protein n=1 Tax=Pigmentiphaga sp. TaxID=1977564 RepID=UPI0029A11EB5|nr:flavin reductase family protein [Pigmentiphaga sp.]MDX3905826.1 flavin reductase family protein [Pigmentiphaga sp.]